MEKGKEFSDRQLGVESGRTEDYLMNVRFRGYLTVSVRSDTDRNT